MSHSQRELLCCIRLPGRLVAEEAAFLIGCQAHDIAVLVRLKLLVPLGQPVQNSTKYFCAQEIVEKSQDRAWLNKATSGIQKSWKQSHLRRRSTVTPLETKAKANQKAPSRTSAVVDSINAVFPDREVHSANGDAGGRRGGVPSCKQEDQT